jgi:hypothetical protein
MDYLFYFCSCSNTEGDNEAALLRILRDVSADVPFRSERGQLASFETDGSRVRVYETLKLLVKKHHYTVQRLDLILSGLNIWLYSIPTPPGHISTNPSTKFQYHRVLRVYLGTTSDWNGFKTQSDKDVYFHLEDTGFEEKE